MADGRWTVKRFLTVLAVAASACAPVEARDENGAAQAVQAPRFEVDPMWPKPLPNRWLLGSATGVTVDARGNVFVIHRNDIGAVFNGRTEVGAATDPPTGECCRPAPNVLQFDAAGNLAGNWGGPGEGYRWPAENQRIAVDRDGNVWVGGVGNGDTQILVFSREGRFLASVGTGFSRIADIAIDAGRREVYVADAGNRRIAVLDLTSGNIKRSWGAYGEAPRADSVPPYDPATPAMLRQFRDVHCVVPSADGHVYVCDRQSNRIQVFRTDGTYVREAVIAPQTRGSGSVWDIALSHDAPQRFLYVADGMNQKIHVLDRASLNVLTTFGTGGRQPGQFYAVHSIAVDAQGNVYTAETLQGKRVQKFNFRGVGEVARRDQGVVWPVRR
jgi:DNA-binding beta-propeller fold protein YncE